VSAAPLLVIKVGGNLAAGAKAAAVAAAVADLAAGYRVVLVHGGGPQATAMQRRLGQAPNVVGGRRITDAAALEVMKMVVGGQINVDLCRALLAAGARPVGLHGASSRAIAAVRRPPRVVTGCGPEPVDFGWVGDVVGVDGPLLELLLGAGHVPVLACLGADEAGEVYNINADIVANQAAMHLGADHLVLVTDVPGVLRDVGDPDSRFRVLDRAAAEAAIADGTIAGGMIPKIEESLRVLGAGVGSVHIVGEPTPGSLRRELEDPGSVGTALL
jgi:acetylglutamate kinase